MKTFILTDNAMEFPMRIEAESLEEAECKARDYYSTQLDILEYASKEYGMHLAELNDLEIITFSE